MTAANWLIAMAMAFTLAASGCLDDPAALASVSEDHSGEWAQSTTLQELQAAEDDDARRQVAAQQLCFEAQGDNSEARWTPEGHLVCTAGHRLVAVQQ